MGKRGKEGKSKPKIDCEEEDSEKHPNNAFVFEASDDEEANEDLSLKIVEKAMSRVASRAKQNKAGISGRTSDVFGISDIITTELVESKLAEKKYSKLKKKKKKKIEAEVRSGEKEEQKADHIKTEELDEAPEANLVVNSNSDNIVLRKLLRGPRYFDPPDNSWGTCYNCGEEGHSAVNCTSARRKKPCFTCGSFDHGAKQCQKGQDCFICKERGHRAKDCPKKFKRCSEGLDLCLKCGASGHIMSSCDNDYSSKDLKEIQCYVCKSFGHLCCANYFDTTPVDLSCYKCGLLGHIGLGCRGSRVEAADSGTPSSCYTCGEAGHFARECTSSAKVKKRSRELSTPRKKSSKFDKDYNQVKSAPAHLSKAKKNKTRYVEEESSRSLNKRKKRGWITDDPGDVPANGWHYPSTPKSKRYPYSTWTEGHLYSPRYSKGSSKSYASSSNMQGSANRYRHNMQGSPHVYNPNMQGSPDVYRGRYSASRFGNTSHDSSRRQRNWW